MTASIVMIAWCKNTMLSKKSMYFFVIFPLSIEALLEGGLCIGGKGRRILFSTIIIQTEAAWVLLLLQMSTQMRQVKNKSLPWILKQLLPGCQLLGIPNFIEGKKLEGGNACSSCSVQWRIVCWMRRKCFSSPYLFFFLVDWGSP